MICKYLGPDYLLCLMKVQLLLAKLKAARLIFSFKHLSIYMHFLLILALNHKKWKEEYIRAICHFFDNF